MSSVDVDLGLQQRGDGVKRKSQSPWWRLFGSPERLLFLGLVVVAAIVVLYPLGWLVAGSFGLPDALSSTGFSSFVHDRANVRALANTLILAAGAGVLSAVFGAPLAWLAACTDLPAKKALHAAVAITFITPGYLMALGYSTLAAPRSGYLNRLYGAAFGTHGSGPFNVLSLPGVIFIVSLHGFAFVYFLTYNALRTVDNSLEQAARILGSGRVRTVLRITLPLVMPAITAGALFAAVQSTVMLGTQIFLGVPGNVTFLSTRLYEFLQGIPAQYAAAAVIGLVLIAITAAGLLLQRAVLGRRSYVTVGGKGGASELIGLGRAKAFAAAACWAVMTVAFVLPVGLLLLTSLRTNWLGNLSWSTFTLGNYRDAVVHSSEAHRGIANSCEFAAICATACTVIAFLTSYISQRTTLRGRRLLDTLMMLPLGLPGVALAVGLILGWLRAPIPVYGTMWIIVLSYIAGHLPFALRTATSGMRQVDPSLEEAARITGANWAHAVRRVSVPLLRSSLVLAWILVFVPSFSELGSTLLLYSPNTMTISIAIFNFQENGEVERMAALAMTGVVVTLLLSGLVALVTVRVRRRLGAQGDAVGLDGAI